MTNDAVTPPDDDLALLRAFEPVVRFTKGEMFFPVGVDAYVACSALWQSTAGGDAAVAAQPGDLDLGSLAVAGAQEAGPGQSLSAVNTGRRIPWRERLRLRDHREHLKGGSRLAEVGILGRTIDSISRLSLIFRGSVPGGSAAVSMRIQNEHLDPSQPVYYGRVVRDAGYLMCAPNRFTTQGPRVRHGRRKAVFAVLKSLVEHTVAPTADVADPTPSTAAAE